jgi:transcriptional regulator with XRE-family HTH domain
MTTLLGSALTAARKQKKLTQQQVADALGVSRVAIGQWESGNTSPSTANLLRVCNLLGLNVAAATSGMVQIKTLPKLNSGGLGPETFQYATDRRPEFRDISDEFIRHLDANPNDPDRARDLPVYACSYAGSTADYFRTDEIIDFVRRPPAYRGKHVLRGVYAIYVASAALAPRFQQGEVIIVSSDRVPAPGDFVAIQLIGDRADERQRWLLRKLITRNDRHIECEKLLPSSMETIDSKLVLAVHRIMDWPELIDF